MLGGKSSDKPEGQMAESQTYSRHRQPRGRMWRMTLVVGLLVAAWVIGTALGNLARASKAKRLRLLPAPPPAAYLGTPESAEGLVVRTWKTELYVGSRAGRQKITHHFVGLRFMPADGTARYAVAQAPEWVVSSYGEPYPTEGVRLDPPLRCVVHFNPRNAMEIAGVEPAEPVTRPALRGRAAPAVP